MLYLKMLDNNFMLTKDNTDNFKEWYKNIEQDGGFGLFVKYKGWTSMDLVAKLRKLSKIKKVGHSGTLDPLADGLMIIAFGKATKKMYEFSNLPKSYLATVKFGARTASFDSEMPEYDIKTIDDLNETKILETLKEFTGTISQKPPIYSAKSFKGKKLYKFIRDKQTPDIDAIEEIRKIKQNEIQIYEISLINFNYGIALIDVKCSTGTYIRTLADDIGQRLGCGAYLLDLTRTGIGDYQLEKAISVDAFEKLILTCN